MASQFSRTELLFGEEFIKTLSKKHIAIFGLGGVGGYAAEALVRSGIGRFDLVDHDKVSFSNLNRQIIATYKTIGRDKVEVMKERMLDINPSAEITVRPCFFLPENADSFDFGKYDYVIDAVDTVTAKIELILRAQAAGTFVISCMGTGNKLNPAMLETADIYDTSVCPLAKVMRHELRKRGVKGVKVVYSKEEPVRPGKRKGEPEDLRQNGSKENLTQQNPRIPGSTAFVPSAAGLLIASEVVRDLFQDYNNLTDRKR